MSPLVMSLSGPVSNTCLLMSTMARINVQVFDANAMVVRGSVVGRRKGVQGETWWQLIIDSNMCSI